MKIDTRVEKECLIIVPDGRMDAHNSPGIHVKLDRILNGAHEKIVILDLGRVEYLSSSGLHVLVSVARDLKKSNRDLRLCRLPEAVLRVLELMEITGMFAIYDSEQDALDGKESG